MPSVDPHCHELRITDEDKIWRMIYRIDAMVIAEVFKKKTDKTPESVIEVCKI